jgi:hypothetical protein
MLRGAKILLIILVMGVSHKASAQLLTNLGEYRNQVFLNSGYYLSFANYSVGWIHNEHVKFIKRDVAGILDFSFPYSDTSHTKFVFRKGFQTNIWANETFRLPIALISSSDKVVTHLTRIHNFVTDFFFNPGIYRKFYTVALDLDWKVIWFTHHKEIHASTAPDPNSNVLSRAHSKFAAGLALGLNYKRFTYLLRGGYQERADLTGQSYAFYAVFQVGYNCNFKKRKAEEIKPTTSAEPVK